MTRYREQLKRALTASLFSFVLLTPYVAPAVKLPARQPFNNLAQAQSVHEKAEQVREIYHKKYAARMVPLLSEVLKFPTIIDNAKGHADQKIWLAQTAAQFGFITRDCGMITEIELPGAAGLPVLGLVVHGDVQPVVESDWHFPPFAGHADADYVYGRGAADDKGPLIQALLTMKALQDSGLSLSYTVRLLVGSDEESGSTDIGIYLKDHKAPDLSLVLDSEFPVVVGEKAWNALDVTVTDPYKIETRDSQNQRSRDWAILELQAGLAASIVPNTAVAKLQWQGAPAGLSQAIEQLTPKPASADYKYNLSVDGNNVTLTVLGHSAHAGVNIEGGRNALVALAKDLQGRLKSCGAADLLDFALIAGEDLHGTGLGLTREDPVWGRYSVNVATIKPAENNQLTLKTNLRRTPPMNGKELQEHLNKVVAAFNAEHNAKLAADGFYLDEPLIFDTESKLIKRLLASYQRATGKAQRPAISGGGTYAKRLPNSIAFGMWFPGKPYPGHDVDERMPIEDLHRGVDVLIEALIDIVCQPPINQPFKK